MMKKYRFILLITLIGFIVYANSLFNRFVWDDEEQILNNSLVHSISNIPSFFKGGTFNVSGSPKLTGIYYRPLMTSFFSILYTVFGPNPFPFHLFQFLIHIVNTVIVFFILQHFLKRDWLSFFLATLFLVHPINTEAVVYSAALQDVLSFFFGSFALLLVIKNSRMVNYLIAAIYILLGLLTKETTALFIPIIFVYILLVKKEKPYSFLISLVPFLTIYSALRFLIARIYFTKFNVAPIANLSFWERMINMPKIILYYLKLYLWPQHIAVSQHWIVKNFSFSGFFLPLVLDLIFFFCLIYFGSKLFLQKRKLFSIYLFFVSIFLLGLGFHLQILPLDMTVADRWFYSPHLGLLGVFGTIYLFYLDRINIKKVIFFPILIVLVLSARTIIRNMDWKDGYTLYSHDVQISKNAFDLENNVGVELGKVKQWEESKRHFEKSIKLAPEWWPAYNNLAVYYALYERNTKKAEKLYRISIAKGNYYNAYENLAYLLLSQKKYNETIELSEKGLSYFPNNIRLIKALVITYYQNNNKEKALELAKYLYQLSPTMENKKLVRDTLQN